MTRTVDAEILTLRSSTRSMQLGRALAALTILLITSRQFIGEGVTFGDVATLATAPMWVPVVLRYAGGRVLTLLTLLATVMSVALTAIASTDHLTAQNQLVANSVLILGIFTGVGVLLWARELMPIWLVALIYGLGLLISGLTRPGAFDENPWKFAIGVPIGVIALAVASSARSRAPMVLVLVGLGAASAFMDSRSYFAEFFIAAALVVWQMLPARPPRRGAAARVTVIFGIVVVAAYQLGTAALVSGLLGRGTQLRSIAQIDRAGSIIVGGRPEMGATAALFLHRPIGYGAGTLVNFGDLEAAKTGMSKLHYNPDNGYVTNFLFGLKVELHSIVGDLWAYAGFAGILLAIACFVLLTTIVTRGIVSRTASGLVFFVAMQSFWNLFFNPLYASSPILVLALGLGLIRVARPARDADSAAIALDERSHVSLSRPLVPASN